MSLYEIITSYRHIIENKKTDAVSAGLKNDAWKQITQEYNNLGKYKRSLDQIKTCYRTAVLNLKKDLAADRADCFRTGGGIPQQRVSENHPLLSIVQPAVTPLFNPHDSSASYFNVSFIFFFDF